MNNKNKPVITHVVTSLIPDGAQRQLFYLVTNLKEFEHKIISLKDATPYKEKYEEKGIYVASANLNAGLIDFSKLLYLRKLIFDTNPSVVQSWMFHSNILATLTMMFSKFPVCWNVRTGWNKDTIGRKTSLFVYAGKLLHPFCHKIIYNSEKIAEQFENGVGYPRSKREVIYNWFDSDKFKPCSDSYSAIRNELGISQDSIIISNIARDNPAKDRHTLLRAASKIFKDFENVYLLIAGSGITKDNSTLVHLINELGIQNRVFLLGRRNDPERVLAATDIYCSSSLNEGMPNVVAEAMLCGAYVIATDAGGTAEVVGEFGEVVNLSDFNTMAIKLSEALSMSKEERKHQSAKAEEHIKQNFTKSNFNRGYSELYSNC